MSMASTIDKPFGSLGATLGSQSAICFNAVSNAFISLAASSQVSAANPSLLCSYSSSLYCECSRIISAASFNRLIIFIGILVWLCWLSGIADSGLGELLGKGWAVEGWGIQPFLVAVADIDAAVIEDGLPEVSGEAVSGLIRAPTLAYLDKELGGGGVGDGLSIERGG